jgi:hypothetical protein
MCAMAGGGLLAIPPGMKLKNKAHRNCQYWQAHFRTAAHDRCPRSSLRIINQDFPRTNSPKSEYHSLFMLKSIAEALDERVEIRFMPIKRLKTA